MPADRAGRALSEAEFERVADDELQRLLEALIEHEQIDPDLASGVLTIVFEDNTKYVVNSHRAARQIWLAAEQSAWHFDYDDAGSRRWVSGDDELWATVTAVLQRKLGVTVELA